MVWLALLALVLLAAALPGLQFRAGQRFVVGQQDSAAVEQPEPVEPAGLQHLVGSAAQLSLADVVILVLLLAFVIFLIVSPKERKRFLRRLVTVLGVLALFLFLREHPEVLAPIGQNAVPAAGAAVPTDGTVVEFDATAPVWLHWAVTVGMAVALALTASTAARLYRRRQKSQVGPLERIAAEAQGALEALLAGGDVRDTILRCYFQMSRVVSQERSLTRGKAMTPREFEEYLAEAGLPGAAVRRLTRLFERVRYGAQQVAHAEEMEALDCLAEVIDACRVGADAAQAAQVLQGLAVQGAGSSEPGLPARTARRATGWNGR
jgi:hypothetical protein